jgi:ribosomal protein L19E
VKTVHSLSTRNQGLSCSAHREQHEEHECHDGHGSLAGVRQSRYDPREQYAPVRTFVSIVSRTMRGKT